jgi:flagellar biosynthesis protein FlhA
MASAVAFLGFRMERKKEEQEKASRRVEKEEKKNNNEELEDLLGLEMVELEVGYGLVNIVDAEQDGDLLERISHIRKQFVTDWG